MRQVIRASGEILLTAGVVGLLFLGYLVWGTGLRAASAQRALHLPIDASEFSG